MSLPALSVRRPVTALMLMLVVVMLGAVAYSRLSLDLLPKIDPPVAAVITRFQGASPQEVADLVTIPLESAAATVPGTKEITSISQEGMSAIIMMFDWGQNMSQAREDITQRIDLVPLPEGVARPVVVEFDPTLLPIMQISLSAPEGVDLAGLTELATTTIKPRLAGLDGVASVELLGVVTNQITVKLDPGRLNAYRLPQDAVSAVIAASNLSYPLGTVDHEGLVLDLRLGGKFENIDDIKNLVVGYVPLQIPVPGGMEQQVRPVRLSDVATIEEEAVRGSSLARINGKPSVAITVQKEGTANTVFVARAVRRELDKLSSELGGLDIVVSMDQAQFIEETIDSVTDNLLMGAGLAVLVLLVFLRDVRSTLVIGISIPFSVITAFVLIYFGKLTLNIMTMGGLALGVGMLVDNSIVVIENIYQHVERGEDPVRAAISGAEEVQMAITASTLTTVVVFLPVVFVGGVSGILFKELALTVTFSLLASLVVALTVVPVLASKLLYRRTGRREAGAEHGPERAATGRRSTYTRLLRFCIEHRALFLAAVFLGAAGMVYLLLPGIQTEFLPAPDEGNFSISLAMKEGTPLDRVDQVVKKIEEVLNSDESVGTYSVTVGKSEGLSMLQSFFTGSTNARISVQVTEDAARQRATKTVMDRIEGKVKEVTGDALVTFNPQSSVLMMSGSAPGTVEVLISGPDILEVQKLSEEFSARMAEIPGMKSVRSSLSARKPEMMVIVDRDRAARSGLTPAQVALAVSRAVRGQTVSRFEKADEQGSDGVTTWDIVVRFDPDAVKDVSSLEEMMLWGQAGPVRLREVAAIVEGEGPVVIARNNQRMSARLTGQFAERSLGSVTGDLMNLISRTEIPEGYSVSIGGLSEIMQEGFSGLRFALYLAIALVYMVMAASFESLGIPFVIFFTMPLAAVGVLLALYVSGYAFGITAFIGIIVLAGVVVNNGIVLVDFMIQQRKAGLAPREAIIEGARRRVRPVLMTSLTTVLGLIPMALGLGRGGELAAPMALVTMGGLASSTVFTLFVIPVLYSLFAGAKTCGGEQ